MKAALSSALIRITGYVLFRVFNFLFMSVSITEGQLCALEAAAAESSRRRRPLVFVPLHRSHVDYLFVTWVLFNRQVPAPIVAAGDNLRMPFFGSLLRGLGGFFIKRRLESSKSRKDYVYRAVLQTYMNKALHAGYNLEFFIEGGRTRTGKPCIPKGGLLSVVVDAFLSGSLDDALIVPIAVNYDRILDGNFITEQLGQKKVPESFWRTVLAIARVLSTNFGHARIDFSRPFSLRDFFLASKAVLPVRGKVYSPETNNLKPLISLPSTIPTPPEEQKCKHQNGNALTNGHESLCDDSIGGQCVHKSPSGISCNVCTPSPLPNVARHQHVHATRSNSSLFGSELTDEYRNFIKLLASHIVYDAERCQAIMATNAVSYLVSFGHRDGAALSVLAASLGALREDLALRGRDVGFQGEPLDITIHGLQMLGPRLVEVQGDPLRDPPDRVWVRPITCLPNVIELNYYANALLPVYAIDAIVSTSLLSLAGYRYLDSYRDVPIDFSVNHAKLVSRSEKLCHLLRHEFVLAAPCERLQDKIEDAVYRLVSSGLLREDTKSTSRRQSHRTNYHLGSSSEEDEASSELSSVYTLCPSEEGLAIPSLITRSLCPIVESYYATCVCLSKLVGRPTLGVTFVQEVQNDIKKMLSQGTLLYTESITVDAVRNALKLLESDKRVVESYSRPDSGGTVVYLSKKFDEEEALQPLQHELASYRL